MYVVLSPVIIVGVIMFTVYVLVGIQLGRTDVAGIGDRGGGTGTSLHPMIGRLAMIAVTATLAVGVASAFAFGFVHLPGANAPQAAFSFDRAGPTTVEITHQAGDQLDPATLTVRVDGDLAAGSWQPTPVTSGSWYRVTGVEPGATITVDYIDGEGWSATLATHEAGE
jgi:FlaG/FlaF family flagellin (archaellin)